jgi:hypothetical protein
LAIGGVGNTDLEWGTIFISAGEVVDDPEAVYVVGRHGFHAFERVGYLPCKLTLRSVFGKTVHIFAALTIPEFVMFSVAS